MILQQKKLFLFRSVSITKKYLCFQSKKRISVFIQILKLTYNSLVFLLESPFKLFLGHVIWHLLRASHNNLLDFSPEKVGPL